MMPMPLAERDTPPRPFPTDARLTSLRRASARRARLEALFADPAYLDRVLSDGRYIRLCSAIAWASEREEQARAAVAMDWMVERLRQAKTAAPSGIRQQSVRR